MTEIIDLNHKRIEQTITSIGAKVANAFELTQRAKELSLNSENTLISAQLELEELYLLLSEYVNNVTKD